MLRLLCTCAIFAVLLAYLGTLLTARSAAAGPNGLSPALIADLPSPSPSNAELLSAIEKLSAQLAQQQATLATLTKQLTQQQQMGELLISEVSLLKGDMDGRFVANCFIGVNAATAAIELQNPNVPYAQLDYGFRLLGKTTLT